MPSHKKKISNQSSEATGSHPKETLSIFQVVPPQVILALFAILIYLPTLKYGFVLDDGLVTTINDYVKEGVGGLWKIFTHSYRAGASITTDSDYMYRPLSVMMFAIEWDFLPNQAWIHHFINIICYSLSIVVMYNVLNLLLGRQQSIPIFFICLLFLVHPIHTEVVCNIKSRDEILSFLFGMTSLFYYLKSLQDNNKLRWISCLFFFLAMLSKEGSITWLFLFPLISYFFTTTKFWINWGYLVLTCVAWFLLRHSVMGNVQYIPDIHDNQLVGLDLYKRWATAFVVLLKYLKLLFCPLPLSWDYSFQEIKNVGWESAQAYLSLGIHLVLFVYSCIKIRTKEIFAFCILAYLISMSLYSNLFLLIGTLLGERLTFQASVWICIAIVTGVHRLTKSQNDKPLFLKNFIPGRFISLITLLIVVFCWLTIQRSKDWKSSYDLFLKDVYTSPESFRTNQAIADESLQLYMKKYNNPSDSAKYLTQAQLFYEASEKILKTFSNQVGLGNTSLFQRNYSKAIEKFKSAQNLIDNAVIRERLVTAYYQFGRYEAQINNNLIKAKELLTYAYNLDSSKTEIVTDLGMVLGLNKEFKEALNYFEKSYQMDPKNETTINNLLRTYILLGYQEKADELALKIKK